MGSKIGIVWNRMATKRLLGAAMKMSHHNQDRSFLLRRMNLWKRSAATHHVIAVDVSKFDKGHGGDFLRKYAKYAAMILRDSKVEDDFLAEVSLPMMVSMGSQFFFTEDQVAPQLPSGVSFTTVCGLFFGDYISRYIGQSAGMSLSGLGSTWDYLNWGDDMVLFIPKTAGSAEAILTKASAALGLELEEEPSLKYLGFNYGSGVVSTRGGYSVARLVSKIFLPERAKVYPYSVVGYTARLRFIPDPEKFHDKFLRQGWFDSLGDPFPYSQRGDAEMQALKKIAEAPASFDRDALNFILHGLDPGEGQNLLQDSLGLDFDFETWLGGGFADLTDPGKFAAESEFFPDFREELNTLGKIGLDGLHSFSIRLAGYFNLQMNGGILF
jgi:hypothetical protein